jgi:flagellar assembly protein FliH
VTPPTSGPGVTRTSGARHLDGQGLSVHRHPPDPGRPIDYTVLSPSAAVDAVATEHGAPAAGYEAGYSDGRRDAEAGIQDAERRRAARVERAVSALGRSVDEARAAYAARWAELEGSVPQFAFDLLEALFGREARLSTDPGREAVARALALDRSTVPAAVRLHPEDAATVGDLADLAPDRQLTVVADPTVEPGGALVEIGSTTIDSQLSQALERVREVIVGSTGGGGR